MMVAQEWHRKMSSGLTSMIKPLRNYSKKVEIELRLNLEISLFLINGVEVALLSKDTEKEVLFKI